jgi:hypothetical protein
VKYYGIVVLYGSKDFSDENDPLSLKPEMVAFVAANEKAREFTARSEVTGVRRWETAYIKTAKRQACDPVSRFADTLGRRHRQVNTR